MSLQTLAAGVLMKNVLCLPSKILDVWCPVPGSTTTEFSEYLPAAQRAEQSLSKFKNFKRTLETASGHFLLVQPRAATPVCARLLHSILKAIYRSGSIRPAHDCFSSQLSSRNPACCSAGSQRIHQNSPNPKQSTIQMPVHGAGQCHELQPQLCFK